MGISWSSRRRNNSYYHNPPPFPPPHYPSPPPPHQYFSSSHYYLTESPPPPPPAHNYVYTNTSTPYPPAHNNVYSSHPPPPPHTHYFSGGHGSFPYANYMVGRFNYHPYYANQANGWTPIRPPVGQMQPLTVPPPYVEHENAKKVRNDVNVHKDTLKVEVDEQNPEQHLVSFVFDALFDGSITIYYFAKEESNCSFVPLFPEAFKPVKTPFHKGLGQKFCQPSGTGIDMGFFALDDLSKPSPEDVFPLVISAETCLPAQSIDSHIGDTMPDTSPHMQITQGVLEKNNSFDPFLVRVIRQILWIDGIRYELREIYGLGSSTTADFEDNDCGKDCVICMTEPKDTAVLPCRHMCMCSECAKELRLQTNKCPICRQPIEELLEIKINNVEQIYEVHIARKGRLRVTS